MSNLMQFFSSESAGLIIPNLTIAAGEALVPGDVVGLNYNEELVKVAAQNVNTVAASVTVATSNVNMIEYANDKYVCCFMISSTQQQINFYDAATNTAGAGYQIADTSVVLEDVKQNADGSVLVLVRYSTGQLYVYKFTGAGAYVSNSGVLGTNTYASIHIGAVAGEFFLVSVNGTFNLVVARLSSTYAQQSSFNSTSVAYSTSLASVKYRVARGATKLCIAYGAAIGTLCCITVDLTAGTKTGEVTQSGYSLSFITLAKYDPIYGSGVFVFVAFSPGWVCLHYLIITESTGGIFFDGSINCGADTGAGGGVYALESNNGFCAINTSNMAGSAWGWGNGMFYNDLPDIAPNSKIKQFPSMRKEYGNFATGETLSHAQYIDISAPSSLNINARIKTYLYAGWYVVRATPVGFLPKENITNTSYYSRLCHFQGAWAVAIRQVWDGSLSSKIQIVRKPNITILGQVVCTTGAIASVNLTKRGFSADQIGGFNEIGKTKFGLAGQIYQIGA